MEALWTKGTQKFGVHAAMAACTRTPAWAAGRSRMWALVGSPVGFRGMGLFNRDRFEGKTPEQLAGMRTAGLLVGRTLELLVASVRPGMTTLDLDTLAETHIRDHGGVPNFQARPRLPAHAVHVGQRGDRPRHPRLSRAARG